MELKEFVSSSIQQIVSGIVDAQIAMGGQGVVVPHLYGSGPGTTEDQPAFMLDYDVAVTARQEESGAGGAKLQVVHVFSSGRSKSTAEATESVSRIKFQIPVVFPKDPAAKPHETAYIPVATRDRSFT